MTRPICVHISILVCISNVLRRVYFHGKRFSNCEATLTVEWLVLFDSISLLAVKPDSGNLWSVMVVKRSGHSVRI